MTRAMEVLTNRVHLYRPQVGRGGDPLSLDARAGPFLEATQFMLAVTATVWQGLSVRPLSARRHNQRGQ